LRQPVWTAQKVIRLTNPTFQQHYGQPATAWRPLFLDRPGFLTTMDASRRLYMLTQQQNHLAVVVMNSDGHVNRSVPIRVPGCEPYCEYFAVNAAGTRWWGAFGRSLAVFDTDGKLLQAWHQQLNFEGGEDVILGAVGEQQAIIITGDNTILRYTLGNLVTETDSREKELRSNGDILEQRMHPYYIKDNGDIWGNACYTYDTNKLIQVVKKRFGQHTFVYGNIHDITNIIGVVPGKGVYFYYQTIEGHKGMRYCNLDASNKLQILFDIMDLLPARFRNPSGPLLVTDNGDIYLEACSNITYKVNHNYSFQEYCVFKVSQLPRWRHWVCGWLNR